jgi:hypothetical protein
MTISISVSATTTLASGYTAITTPGSEYFNSSSVVNYGKTVRLGVADLFDPAGVSVDVSNQSTLVLAGTLVGVGAAPNVATGYSGFFPFALGAAVDLYGTSTFTNAGLVETSLIETVVIGSATGSILDEFTPDGVFLADGLLVNQRSGTIEAVGIAAYVSNSNGSNSTIENYGVMKGLQSLLEGRYSSSGGQAHIATLTGFGIGAMVGPVYSQKSLSVTNTLINSGTIQGSDGVKTRGAASIQNSGTILTDGPIIATGYVPPTFYGKYAYAILGSVIQNGSVGGQSTQQSSSLVVSNSGLIGDFGSAGVAIGLAAGTIINETTGTIAGYGSGGAIVTGPTRLTYLPSNVGGTIINYGHVIGEIAAGSTALIVNKSTGVIDGTAGTVGVSLAATLSNDGTIIGGAGTAGSGPVSGGYGGQGVYAASTGSVSNSGTILGGAGGIGDGEGGFGIFVRGKLTNSGTIVAGSGGSGDYGVGLGGIGGSGGTGLDLFYGTLANNTGHIEGGAGGTGGGGSQGGSGGIGGTGGVGLSIGQGATGTNSGIIIGGSGGVGGTDANGFGGGGGFGGVGLYMVGGAFSNSGTVIGGTGGLSGISSTFFPTPPSPGVGGEGVYIDALEGKSIFNNTGEIVGGAGVAGIGVVIRGSGTLTNTGTIIGGTDGVALYLTGGTVYDFGSIIGGTDAAQIEAPAVQFRAPTFSNGVTFSAPPSTLVIEAGGTIEGGLSFNTGATAVVIGSYTALSGTALAGPSIAGFAQSDTLILEGFAATTDTYVSGTGLELGNGTSEITLAIAGSFTTSDFSVVDPPGNTTISLNAACFAKGTRIRTTGGEFPVEKLKEGTEIALTDGRMMPVIWLGHRTIDLSRHPHPEAVQPVLIMAGALADNIPTRDLMLSPDHAIALDGHLIPAKALINNKTIRQIIRRSMTYYHVELAEHAVLWAEGTPCESYLETGNRHAFENGHASALALHPAFAPTTMDWQAARVTQSCLPFAEEGPAVEAVRSRILTRANIATSTDADLAITRQADGSVHITSRSAIPGHVSPDPRDQRKLGVKIAAITRRDGTIIPLDHPGLTVGWHGPEPDGRWTNGRAIIPAALCAGQEIRINLAATLVYPTRRKRLTRKTAR